MLNKFIFVLVLLVLLVPQVESAISITYTVPTTAVFDDPDSVLLTYSASSVYRIAIFSGLNNPLSSYAVVTLQLWMPHTHSSDCVVTLKCPTGAGIYITNRRGGQYENVFDGTLFTDSAVNSVATYNFNSSGVVSSLQPESPFSVFRGKNPNGDWRVDFYDNVQLYDGKVSRVILIIQGKNESSFKFFRSKLI